ncbi:hypothetical protein BOX15_Mlig029375g1, partial [Macrostomum lignano]
IQMSILVLTFLGVLLPVATVTAVFFLPRPTNVRFHTNAGSSNQHFGFLVIELSDGTSGPVCNLGKFDLHATRLACVLMGFNASLNVAQLSASESEPPAASPVIAIRDCDDFNLNIRSTWDLSIACKYVIGRDIPSQCRRPENLVQISCHSGSGLPTSPATTSPVPVIPPVVPNGGVSRCADIGSSMYGHRSVELRRNRPLLDGRSVCADQFGVAEAHAFCSALCYGSFIGLPSRLPASTSDARTDGIVLTCSRSNGAIASPGNWLDNCTTVSAPSTSGGCKSGLARLECLPQGDTVNKRPNATVECSDRAFRVAFKLSDGVTTADRLTLESSGVHPAANCSGAARGANATHVWLDLPYTECNVSQGYNSSHQLYRMELRLLPASSISNSASSAPVYTDIPLRYPILCVLPSRDSLAAPAVAVASIPMSESAGQAKFLTDIGLFARLSLSADGRGFEFQQPLNEHRQSAVQLGQPIFARIRLLNVDDSLSVRLQLLECWATDRPDSGSLPRYDLLVNRCPTANVRLIDVSDRIVGLQFLAFRFNTADASGKLYVHCNRSVCNRSDAIGCRGCDSSTGAVLLARQRRAAISSVRLTAADLSAGTVRVLTSGAAMIGLGSNLIFYYFLSVLIMLLTSQLCQ